MKQQRKRHVLAEGVDELSDPAVGFVTVTGVDVTADLEHATVRVSVLGGEKRRAAALRAVVGPTSATGPPRSQTTGTQTA